MSSTQEVGVMGQMVKMGHMQRNMWRWGTSETEGVHSPGWFWRSGTLWPLQGGEGGEGELQ